MWQEGLSTGGGVKSQHDHHQRICWQKYKCNGARELTITIDIDHPINGRDVYKRRGRELE